MKIILQGLEMESKVLNVPNNLGHRYEIAFYEPNQVASYDTGIPPLPPISTRATFSWTGKNDKSKPFDIKNSNDDVIATEYPRIYRLTDIRKF